MRKRGDGIAHSSQQARGQGDQRLFVIQIKDTLTTRQRSCRAHVRRFYCGVLLHDCRKVQVECAALTQFTSDRYGTAMALDNTFYYRQPQSRTSAWRPGAKERIKNPFQ